MSTYNMAAPETVSGAVEAFRRDLGIRRSPHTVEAYTTGLRHFETFCAGTIGAPGREVTGHQITPDVAMGFVRWLQATNPVSRTTLDNYLTAISRFYRWLMLEDRASFAAPTMPASRSADRRARATAAPPPAPRSGRGRRPGLAPGRLRRPLPDDPNTDKGRRAMLRRLRDIALLEVLRSSGARVGEIVALRRGDLDYEAGGGGHRQGAQAADRLLRRTRRGAPSPTI